MIDLSQGHMVGMVACSHVGLPFVFGQVCIQEVECLQLVNISAKSNVVS